MTWSSEQFAVEVDERRYDTARQRVRPGLRAALRACVGLVMKAVSHTAVVTRLAMRALSSSSD